MFLARWRSASKSAARRWLITASISKVAGARTGARAENGVHEGGGEGGGGGGGEAERERGGGGGGGGEASREREEAGEEEEARGE